MSLVHVESGVFYAYIDGVLTPVPIGSGPIDLTTDVTGILPPGNFYSEITLTTTGTINDLDFSNASLVRMNNATDSTINGLVAGVAGQIVTIVSVGAGNVYLAHQNASSVAANRLTNFVISGNTPLATGKGIARYIYDNTTGCWRLITHEQGSVILVSYNAANFTASTGTWGVQSADQTSFNYLIQGKFMIMTVDIDNTDVSNATTKLQITLPGGFTVARGVDQVGLGQNVGTMQAIRQVANPADTFMGYTLFSGQWSATTADNSRVIGQVRVEVN